MKRKLNDLIASPYFSFFVTVALFAILYGAGIMAYKGFSRPQVFLNLFIDNAALIIVTVGITFTLIIVGIIARVFCKLTYFTIAGLIAGSTTDPPALAYSNSICGTDQASVAYSTVYPLTMFLRVLCGQILVLMG